MNWQDINEQQKESAKFNFDYGELLDQLLDKVSINPLVVELGTFLGCSAVYMAAKLKGIRDPFRLYTVDTFDNYGKHKNFFPVALSNFKACGLRDDIRVLACRSWEASTFFDEHEVDLVWVDAGHDFVSAKADLDAWHSRVKPGGILAGHDWSEAGVRLAVERFCFTHSLTPNVWHPDQWASWWFQIA
jgi:predicted O-methyltransferase YrrM